MLQSQQLALACVEQGRLELLNNSRSYTEVERYLQQTMMVSGEGEGGVKRGWVMGDGNGMEWVNK
jgi:hypothetical protein